MARKSKYDPNTFPLRAEDLARKGLTDEQIASGLGISPAAYYKYQKEYIEFMEAIKRGKAPVDVMVENAMLKKALGYEVEETHTYVKVKSDDSREKYVKTTKKHIPSDTTAAIFWLKNRRSNEWKDKQEHNHSGNINWSFDSDDAKV